MIAATRATASVNRFIPIVMVTTEGQAERKREGQKAGATAWIVKPFDAQLLLKVVDKCLKIK